MKRFFSLLFFIFVIAVFLFELYFSIAGAIDVNNKFAELAARGAGGHEILGVGLDILVFGIILFSILGFIFAIISWKIAQYRAVKIISGSNSLSSAKSSFSLFSLKNPSAYPINSALPLSARAFCIAFAATPGAPPKR